VSGSPTVVIVVTIVVSSRAKRHTHRFLIAGDPALTIGCVKGGEAVPVRPPSPGFIAGGCYGIVRREFSRVFQGSALRRPRPGGGSLNGTRFGSIFRGAIAMPASALRIMHAPATVAEVRDILPPSDPVWLT